MPSFTLLRFFSNVSPTWCSALFEWTQSLICKFIYDSSSDLSSACFINGFAQKKEKLFISFFLKERSAKFLHLLFWLLSEWDTQLGDTYRSNIYYFNVSKVSCCFASELLTKPTHTSWQFLDKSRRLSGSPVGRVFVLRCIAEGWIFRLCSHRLHSASNCQTQKWNCLCGFDFLKIFEYEKMKCLLLEHSQDQLWDFLLCLIHNELQPYETSSPSRCSWLQDWQHLWRKLKANFKIIRKTSNEI